jgi:hypothetical protein
MVLRAAHPVCRSDWSEFLAAVVTALAGCSDVTNDQLGRILAQVQAEYRGGPAGVDGT